jgi:hypothetical protein
MATFRHTVGSLICCLYLIAAVAIAQDNSGRISGTVTDNSGAVVAGAKIVVKDSATQFTYKAATDNNGFYIVPNLPPATYIVEVEASGFRKAERTGNDLPDRGHITVDFKLEVGTVTESVVVTAARGETVNTVSGEISRTIDAQQVRDLALNGRNYLELITVLPGVALLDPDQMATTTSLSVTYFSVNGQRSGTSHLAVDGGMNLDSGSNGSQINNVGVDFIREVSVQTSAFSAAYGRNSGAAINVVTKSGTDGLHGTTYEFFRNDFLDAKDLFAPTRPELRFNNFGWTLGGPIAFPGVRKGKLYFFGGQDYKRIRRLTNPTRRTLPTRAERLGDFTDRTNTIRIPGTTQPAPSKNLSSQVTVDGRAILKVYDAMEKYAVSYVDTTAANNAVFQVLNPFDFREDIARIDYHINDKQNLYGRWVHDNYNTIDPFGTFNGSELPTTPTLRNRPGYGPQIGYTYSITPTLINEAKLATSWNGQRTPLEGNNWDRATYGFQFPRIFGGNGLYSTGIPDVTITSFASFNGPARVYLASPTTDITFSDNITYLRGAHQFQGGVMVVRNRKDQNGRSIYDGSVAFNASGNSGTTNFALSDAALGLFRTYQEAQSDPLGFFRFWQTGVYLQDNWKVNSRLSIEIGYRYEYFTPTYTQANNIANFDPSLYNPAQAVKLTTAGLIVPGSGNPFDGIVRAGDGVPQDELGRVPGASSAAVQAVPSGAPHGLYPSYGLHMPRFSFAYAPFRNGKTAIRGGFGVYHDRVQGNLIFSQTLLPPYSGSASYENANLANPIGGAASALAPLGSINAIDPHLKVPLTMKFNLGVQRELPLGMFLQVDYVGDLDRHLLRQPDINQPAFPVLETNQNGAKLPTNVIRPYAGYSNIRQFLSDSTANYNSLQTFLTRRRGNTLFAVSYTWSHALTDTSSDTANNTEGYTDRHYLYGPASFDRRHIFVVSYTYRLPRLQNHMALIKQSLGGWEISGITRAQSGPYLTPTGSTAIGTRRSDYLGGDVSLPTDQRGADHWFNTAAFQTAPDGRLGTAGVGNILGPGLYLWDLSLRKQLPLTERIILGFQAESFNLLNHVNLTGLSVTTSNTAFGSASGSTPARNVQFGMRLSF